MTAWYDPVMRLTMRGPTFKPALVRQAKIQPGYVVLDLGCGTAALTILLKSMYPDVHVIGLDRDSRTLRLAAEQAERSGLRIPFTQAPASAIPYAEATFDRVLSSLLFHHLTPSAKLAAMAEVLRVLKPGGELHIADWGRPQSALARGLFLLVQLLDGFDTTADSVRGRLPLMLESCGFEAVQETQQFATMFGTLALYRARKPR